MKNFLIIFIILLELIQPSNQLNKKDKLGLIERLDDIKAFKKYLRVNTNVLVIFNTGSLDSKIINVIDEVSKKLKGTSSIVLVNCKEAKKLCKKMRVSPSNFEFKHYKDGEFNKDYDRKLTTKSLAAFLSDPTGDLPWEEDPTSLDVVHIDSSRALKKQLRKISHPTLVMFYAPWCGHCKTLKPAYAEAATSLKSEYVLVAMDLNKPENSDTKEEFNVTGFPTLIYFRKGEKHIPYGGKNTKDGIIEWMNDPQPPKPPVKEKEWSEEESDVVHLTDDNFDQFVGNNPSTLVMFYAPWCGHCKSMKPGYAEAATLLKEENNEGKLSAVDVTKSSKLGERFEIKGFPTMKYFKNGKLEDFEVNVRNKDSVIEFMKDPKAPPPPEKEWEETSTNIDHLSEENFNRHLKKKKYGLVFYYAPWCGHCKSAKPELEAAAAEMVDYPKVSFAAVNCIKNTNLCSDVTGYPTLVLYNYGKVSIKYAGGRKKEDFVSFMKDPENPDHLPKAPNPKDSWSDVPNGDTVIHLSESSFDEFISKESNVLAFFYAPWCGHCKTMKPDFAEASKIIAEEKIDGKLIAIDATMESALAQRFDIKGYPTLIHFKDGKKNIEYDRQRNVIDLVDFMKNQISHKHEDL